MSTVELFNSITGERTTEAEVQALTGRHRATRKQLIRTENEFSSDIVFQSMPADSAFPSASGSCACPLGCLA
jgi:hypothetical protein